MERAKTPLRSVSYAYGWAPGPSPAKSGPARLSTPGTELYERGTRIAELWEDDTHRQALTDLLHPEYRYTICMAE